MSYFKSLSVFIFSVFLFACGGGNSGGNDNVKTSYAPVTDKNTRIDAFSIKGGDARSKGAIAISPNIKSGLFKVSWKAESSDPYDVDLYLSNDSFLSDKTDIKIFEQVCGLSADYKCDNDGLFDCKFTSENKISCGKVTLLNKQKDISSFLNKLPKKAFLIIEICNRKYTSCKVSSKAVEFQ